MKKEIIGTPIWEQIHKRMGHEVMADSGMQAVAMIQSLVWVLSQKGIINEEDMQAYREKYDDHMRISVNVGTYSLLKSPNMRVHVNREFLPSVYQHLIDCLKEINLLGTEKGVEKAEKEAQDVLGESWKDDL